MPRLAVAGLHHVTAISGPPQPNLDFYTGALRQRLVKKTVNFDDPGTYHLYYGDHAGRPGTILTFFPFEGAQPGRPGPGMTRNYAYAIAADALDGFTRQLNEAGIRTAERPARFGERVVAMTDPDGAEVELIGTKGTVSDIPDGFHSVTLWVRDPAPTARILRDVFGYEEAGHATAPDHERLRFRAPGGARGTIVDILRTNHAERARPGAGTIHHVAFRASDDSMQDALREALSGAGMQVTPRIDRQYFNAIYFREPGGILFEVATDPPGFAVDEPLESMGEKLMLPPQYEAYRERIAAHLPPLEVKS